MSQEAAPPTASLEQQFRSLTLLLEEVQSSLKAARTGTAVMQAVQQIAGFYDKVQDLRKQVAVIENDWRSLKSLAGIGQVVNSSLELDEVLQIVMDAIIEFSGAERGFLMLKNEDDELVIRVARNWEQESLEPTEFAISRTVIYRVANEGAPVITTNAQEDPRFVGQQSVVTYNLRSILCVPLKLKNELIGVIYTDNRIRSGMFTSRHLDLLAAFANQAAVAIDNARLFASVRRTLAEVTELKNLMDNVFFSIASGVVTTDVQRRIVMVNRAAELILGRFNRDMIGQPLDKVLECMSEPLQPHISDVLETDHTVTGLEITPNLPSRGEVDLRLSLAPLKDGQHNTQGVAIVMEDLTEKNRLEAKRRLFERMVSPAVIEQINPNSLQLGGKREQITTLFADIRGYTHFSEQMSPEEVVKVLNSYLSASADAVLKEEGTIDKFLGDAIMAWFNSPIPQPDHTLRAVRAALGMRQAIAVLHQTLPAPLHLNFGVGIHVGEAVLGLIGTEKIMNYTAIGDSVNTAKRIQENAGPGQILLSQSAYDLVCDQVQARPVEPVQAKGKRDPVTVYEIVGLK